MLATPLKSAGQPPYRRYTGFKDSPYTEGALFYGEKLAAGQTRDDVASQAKLAAAPVIDPACKPGGT